jgi:hypothetical protein
MLLVPAAFSDVIVGVHVLGAIVGFGIVFAYPLLLGAAARRDPGATPFLLRARTQLGRYIVNPGLLVVVLAGIYLASDEHRWSAFFVQWGIGVAIVIGAVVGSFMIPREGKLAKLAARDLEAAGVGASGAATADDVAWSEEYLAMSRQVAIGGAILDLLVVITVFVMAAHAGA